MDYGHALGLVPDDSYHSFLAYRAAVAERVRTGIAPAAPAALAPWTTEGVAFEAAVEVKYAGYIGRQRQQAAKLKKLEGRRIPAGFDYDGIPNLPAEARQKLKTKLPGTIAQASRIPGVTPADVGVLLVYLAASSRSSRKGGTQHA